MSVKFCSSVLMVKDISASRKFYEGLLMQKVELDHGPCIGFSGGFSIWQIEHAEKIIFGNANPKDDCKSGRHSFELYFESEALSDTYDRIINEGIKLVHDTFEQPWGQRVFRVYDPDGYIVEIAEPMPIVIKRYLGQGMTPEDIAAKTAMPLEIVVQVEKDMN